MICYFTLLNITCVNHHNADTKETGDLKLNQSTGLSGFYNFFVLFLIEVI